MGHLVAGRVFRGAGLAVLAWNGDAGDSHYSESDVLVRRSEYASCSIVCRGSFQMTEFPESSGPWPAVTPGQLCNLVLPDFLPGKYTWTAQEKDSFELCAGGVDHYGQQDMGPLVYEPRAPGSYIIQEASILVVATGSVTVDGKVLPAPTIVHAKSKAVPVVLNGQGMWLKRL